MNYTVFMPNTTSLDIWDNPLQIPSPLLLKQKAPLSASSHAFVQAKREELRQILEGRCPRMALIVGPCSIHDTTAALEYATRLKKLSDQVSDTFLVIMRAYFEKPRTELGWRGFFYDPFLDGSNQIAEGILRSRQLLASLCELGIPAATEFLCASSPQYLGDLITWGCIGARTVASQPHRQLASALPMPVGFKNGIDGQLDQALQALITASVAHTFIGTDKEGRLALVHSQGNPHVHMVLRGGTRGSNSDPETVRHATKLLERHAIPQKIFIDCGHDNSGKCLKKQAALFAELTERAALEGPSIAGFMLESNLHGGKQLFQNDPSKLRYGVSITDPCLDWETTEELIIKAHECLKNHFQITYT